NLHRIAADTALLSFSAIAAMLVLLVGGLDISLGALMALSAGAAGKLWQAGRPLYEVILMAVAVGTAGGALNALLSLLGRVHPIVVTLGTMSVYRGLTLWWLQGEVHINAAERAWLFADTAGVPLVVWLALALAVLVALWLTFTPTGRAFYAEGSNPAAAHRVG